MVCHNIERQSSQALTTDQFFWKTIFYYLRSTGIPINFGMTIALGFVIGATVTGQTFYLFTVENLKQFGSLKAMGLTNRRIRRMILAQAVIVGAIGYCLGIGAAAVFFTATRRAPHMTGIYFPPQAAGLVARRVHHHFALSRVEHSPLACARTGGSVPRMTTTLNQPRAVAKILRHVWPARKPRRRMPRSHKGLW